MKAFSVDGVPSDRPDVEYVSGASGHPAQNLDISNPISWERIHKGRDDHGLIAALIDGHAQDPFSRVPGEAIHILSHHLQDHDAVLTADGTGTGKTSQLLRTGYLSLLHQAHPEQAPPKAIIAVPEHLIKETENDLSKWLSSGEKNLPMIGQFEVTSHKELAERLASPDAGERMSGVGYVGIDEAHEFLRFPGVIDHVETHLQGCKKLYATANAFETPESAAFFIGQLDHKSFEQTKEELGLHSEADGRFSYSPDTVDIIEQKRHDFTSQGAMVRRERPFWGKIEIEVADASQPFSEKLNELISTSISSLNDHTQLMSLAEKASQSASQEVKLEETIGIIRENERLGHKSIVYGTPDFLLKLHTELNNPDNGIHARSTLVTDSDARDTQTAKLAEFTGKPANPQTNQNVVPPVSSIILLPESMAAGINGLNQGRIAQSVGDTSTRHMIITSFSTAGDLMQELGRLGRPDTTHPSLATILTTNTPTDQIAMESMKSALHIANKTNGGPVLGELHRTFQEASMPAPKEKHNPLAEQSASLASIRAVSTPEVMGAYFGSDHQGIPKRDSSPEPARAK